MEYFTSFVISSVKSGSRLPEAEKIELAIDVEFELSKHAFSRQSGLIFFSDTHDPSRLSLLSLSESSMDKRYIIRQLSSLEAGRDVLNQGRIKPFNPSNLFTPD